MRIQTKSLLIGGLTMMTVVAVHLGCNALPKEKPRTDKVSGERPNLLFIIADQYRYDALGKAGNKVLKTPNLDALAEKGAFFKHAYTPCAVCAPARASILTGRTVENTGVLSNNQANAPEGSGIMPTKTFDEVLHDNGYTCEYFGKWHSPTFRARIYDNEVGTTGRMSELGRGVKTQYVDYLNQHVPKQPLKKGEVYDSFSERPYTPNPIDRRFNQVGQMKANPPKDVANAKKAKNSKKPKASKEAKFGQADLHGRLEVPAEHSITAFQAKQTLDALERLKDKTFSITCSFHLPHAPMLPTEPYASLFSLDEMVPAASIGDKMTNSPYVRANGRMEMPEYADPEKIKYMMANYYGLTKEVDDWVGKILDKLDELGLSENTIVIFTSDHGEMLGAHGMREKNVFYEESARVPLIIRYPKGIDRNTTVSGYVSLIDLFASILDYCNVPAVPSDGASLRNMINDDTNSKGKYVVTEWLPKGDSTPNYMIVKDGWKMFIPYSAESDVINVLYNLNEDPHELNNLVGNNPDKAKYKDKIEELQSDLLEWLKKNNSSHYDEVKSRKII